VRREEQSHPVGLGREESKESHHIQSGSGGREEGGATIQSGSGGEVERREHIFQAGWISHVGLGGEEAGERGTGLGIK
jgi:hypothetical protein